MNKLNTFLSFVLLSFCLLINVSYADFSSTPITEGSAFSGSANIGSNSWGGYTFKQIKQITYNRFINESESNIAVFDTMVESLTLDGIKILVIEPKTADSNYRIFIGNTNTSFGGYTDVNSNINLFFTRIDTSITNTEVNRVYRIPVNDSTTTTATSVLIDGSPAFGYEYRLSYTIAYSNVDIKQIVYSGGPTWDGSTYFYTTSQNNPTNYDLAGIIDVIKNSTEIKDNIKPYLSDEYFIVPDGTAGDEEVYEIYFYHSLINLSQFEYVYNDILYYDLDKAFLLDENIIVNLIYWIGQNSYAEIVRDVQLFTLYYNPETGTGDIYLTSNMTLNELKSFNSETQPIIYTTKDIAYYSATWGETDTEWTATADETKNVLTTEIVDSEGNVINPSVSDAPDLTVIIDNVDFDEINKTFEENKGILNIENASWLFTANNKLIGYFIGFLSLLIVFLIISRVLGG